MRPRFPGRNPDLENPELWSEVHFGLIAVLARSLNCIITPKYRTVPSTEETQEVYQEAARSVRLSPKTNNQSHLLVTMILP